MLETSTMIYFTTPKNKLKEIDPLSILESEQPGSLYNDPQFNCMDRNALEMYVCEICGIKVYLKVNLQVHKEIMHKFGSGITIEKFCALSDINYNFTNILKQYTCKNCDFRTFSLLVHLKHTVHHPKYHKKKVLLENPILWKCNYDNCRFETRRERYLMNHMRDKHFDSENVESIKWFECNQCPMKTNCEKALLKHAYFIHSRRGFSKRYSCELCPFRSMYKSNWRLHMSCQHADSQEIRVFQCNLCSYRAKQKKHLESHVIWKHTAPEDVKWYKCDHCPYKAKQKYILNGHVLARHTASEKIKWFMCEECSFKCKRRTHLKLHKLRHSEHKPMLCEICSAQFKRLNNLKQHILRKHKIKT